jgi:hypothetical protein
MKRTFLVIGAGLAAVMAALAFAAPASAQPYGWGARGNLRADCPIYRKYGPGYMRHPPGYGRWARGPGRGYGPGYGPGWRRGPGYGPGPGWGPGRNW